MHINSTADKQINRIFAVNTYTCGEMELNDRNHTFIYADADGGLGMTIAYYQTED